MESWNERSVRLLGEDAVERLRQAKILVVGVGGVGGYAAEMLVRGGVGNITLVDSDCVDITNLNRQIIALHDNLQQPKTAVMAKRARQINPEVNICELQMTVEPDNVEMLLSEPYDCVLDCIDTVAPKTALLAHCLRNKIPVISSMGAGGRTDPSKIIYTDIWKTEGDGLARAVRQRLRKLGLKSKLPVVASTEIPHSASLIEINDKYKRSSYGTVAPLPATFGIFMASWAMNRITG